MQAASRHMYSLQVECCLRVVRGEEVRRDENSALHSVMPETIRCAGSSSSRVPLHFTAPSQGPWSLYCLHMLSGSCAYTHVLHHVPPTILHQSAAVRLLRASYRQSQYSYEKNLPAFSDLSRSYTTAPERPTSLWFFATVVSPSTSACSSNVPAPRQGQSPSAMPCHNSR
jgi:hypothetical protein